MSGSAFRDLGQADKTDGCPALNAAQGFLGRGWSVVPVEVGKKKPASFWKKYQTERASQSQLSRWFDPRHGGHYTDLGIVLGAVSGRLAARDFDDIESYNRWSSQHPELSQILPTAKTHRGFHVYFRIVDGSPITKTLHFEDGELRFEGAFIKTPPSMHEEGVRYVWLTPLPSGDILEIEPGEAGLIGRSIQKKSGSAKISKSRIPQGRRNDTLTRAAGKLRRRGASADAILTDLLELNRSRCDPPLTQDEVESIARSIGQYPPQSGEIIRLTEMGNARRLVNRHGQDLRFVGLANRWSAWDGRRWRPDDNGEVDRRMKDTVRSIYQESVDCTNPEMRGKIAGWAIKSESHRIIRASIALAQSEPEVAVLPSIFDTDPWLFNCLNGTLDLRTGELQPHNRADLITRLAPVEYAPEAQAPQWQDFLDRVTDSNKDLQTYLKRAIGYALTGDNSEQVFFILFGTGKNGKSKFLEILRIMLGDYALNAPAKTLVVRSPNDATNDQARLNGARMVTATEWEEGQRLAEGFVKQVTGGDTLTARFLHKEFVDFVPTFKLFLGTNHKPQIRGGDLAMQRRIRMIPFTVTIPEEERDKRIIDKLRTELPGILSWAVSGCLEWQQFGLGDSPAVTDATASYCEEMDVMGRFIAECCIELAGLQTKAGILFKCYIDWCARNGEKPMTQTAFGMRLGERGYVKMKVRGISEWSGVGLVTNEPSVSGVGGTVEDS